MKGMNNIFKYSAVPWSAAAYSLGIAVLIFSQLHANVTVFHQGRLYY